MGTAKTSKRLSKIGLKLKHQLKKQCRFGQGIFAAQGRYNPGKQFYMKSVLEIITILAFIFCITMLERLDNNCGPIANRSTNLAAKVKTSHGMAVGVSYNGGGANNRAKNVNSHSSLTQMRRL